MQKKSKKTIEFQRYKAAMFIGCLIALSLAILTFSNWATTSDKNKYFSYNLNDNTESLIHVVDNVRLEIPFVFDIGQGILEVSLTLSGKHAEISGITLNDTTVPVIDGKATSKMIIQLDSDSALKAGTHFVPIVAEIKQPTE